MFSSLLLAQEGWCPSDSIYKARLENDPSFRFEAQKFEEAWQKSQLTRVIKKAIPNPLGLVSMAYNPPYHYDVNRDRVYTVPVVFHLILPGNSFDDGYDTDEEIKKALADVNEAFWGIDNVNDGPRDGGVYVPIQFALAKRDINGNPTTGIVRVNASSLPGYVQNGMSADTGDPGVPESAINNLSRWDPDVYLNIYVLNKISGGTVSGFAYRGNEGVYIQSSYLSQNTSTFPHELGHVFNLLHVFEGGDRYNCPPNYNCMADNDRVCDTAPVRLLSESLMPRIGEQNPCTRELYDGVEFNFMGYTGSMRDRFTEGQVNRMVLDAESKGSKFNMLNFHKAYLPPENRPNVRNAKCIPFERNALDEGSFGVFFGDFRYILGYGEKYYTDYTHSKNTLFVAGESYPIDISSEMKSRRIHVFIDYNNDGDFKDPGENVFTKNVRAGKKLSDKNPNYKIEIPNNAVKNTPLRMRIVGYLKNKKNQFPKPYCNRYNKYGRVRDFTVTIVDPAPSNNELHKVGINTETPETTLEIKSTENGVVFPKMTNREMWRIESPEKGMVIYNTSEHCLAMNYGTSEQPLWRCLKTRNMN